MCIRDRYQCGDNQNEYDGLQVSQTIGLQQHIIDGPGSRSCHQHYKDNRSAHAHCRIQLLGYTQEGADTQELGQRVVVNQDRAEQNNHQFFHGLALSLLASQLGLTAYRCNRAVSTAEFLLLDGLARGDLVNQGNQAAEYDEAAGSHAEDGNGSRQDVYKRQESG